MQKTIVNRLRNCRGIGTSRSAELTNLLCTQGIKFSMRPQHVRMTRATPQSYSIF